MLSSTFPLLFLSLFLLLLLCTTALSFPLHQITPLARSLQSTASEPVTIRICAGLAALPISLKLLSHILITVGHRIARGHKHPAGWCLVMSGLYVIGLSNFIAIPIGVALLIAGLVFADLDISVVGITTLGLVYALQVGDWGCASRIWTMNQFLPDMVSMQTWRVDGRGDVCTFGRGAKIDPYDRTWGDFKRILSRAEGQGREELVKWSEEVILAILSSKFVALTAHELHSKPSPEDNSPAEWCHARRRFEKGWDGLPGKQLRKWCSFESGPPETPKSNWEVTLRFIIVLFELVCRNEIQSQAGQKRILKDIVNVSRNSDMTWVKRIADECMGVVPSTRIPP